MWWSEAYGSIVAPFLIGWPKILANLDSCIQIGAHVSICSQDPGGLLGYSVIRHYNWKLCCVTYLNWSHMCSPRIPLGVANVLLETYNASNAVYDIVSFAVAVAVYDGVIISSRDGTSDGAGMV